MGIDAESDVPANLQVGPTTLGMVRLYVEAEGIELPLDFEPEEAEEIAEELIAAARRAREIAAGAAGGGRAAGSKAGGGKAGGGKGGGGRGGAAGPAPAQGKGGAGRHPAASPSGRPRGRPGSSR
jgi:hypothetical protein